MPARGRCARIITDESEAAVMSISTVSSYFIVDAAPRVDGTLRDTGPTARTPSGMGRPAPVYTVSDPLDIHS
jgi:hypothetical protein